MVKFGNFGWLNKTIKIFGNYGKEKKPKETC